MNFEKSKNHNATMDLRCPICKSSRINYYGTSTTMGGGIKVPMQNMYVRTANMSEH